MALQYGTSTQLEGMSHAIYLEMDALLSPLFGENEESLEKSLNDAREGWKKLSFAIAKGVIDHIKENMEICGIETQGDIATTVEGKTGEAAPDNHRHSVDLSGTQTDVVFTQSNDGTGLVK